METREGGTSPRKESPLTTSTNNAPTAHLTTDQQNASSSSTGPDPISHETVDSRTEHSSSTDISSDTSALASQSSNSTSVTNVNNDHSESACDKPSLVQQTLSQEVHPEEAPSLEIKEVPSNDMKERHLEASPLKGIVMALCCHHQCSWKAYVGKRFLQDLGISERQYMAMVRMTSWATCGSKVARGNTEMQSLDGKMEKEGGDANTDGRVKPDSVNGDRTKEGKRVGAGGDDDDDDDGGAGGTSDAGEDDGQKKKKRKQTREKLDEEEGESHTCPAEQETITRYRGRLEFTNINVKLSH